MIGRDGDGKRAGRREVDGGVAQLVGGAVVLLAVLFALLLLLAPKPAAGQGLADFDYEHLRFRGVMLDVGQVVSSKVDGTHSFGARLDLGYLGPGVRVVVGLNRWSSTLVRSEVRSLEERIEELIFDQTGESTSVELGPITWSDVALSTDAHFVWRVPLGVLTYAGLGGTAHVLRGSGEAIDGTFVEDLLDSVRAGINAHTGLEVPVHDRVRFVGEARYELLQSLQYVQFRFGAQFMFGLPAPGEMGR